jgi:hypothetical protein
MPPPYEYLLILANALLPVTVLVLMVSSPLL